MTATVEQAAQQTSKATVKRPWTPPRVECLETRPEVTAYSGVGGPWLTSSR